MLHCSLTSTCQFQAKLENFRVLFHYLFSQIWLYFLKNYLQWFKIQETAYFNVLMTFAERPSYICLKFGPHCDPHLWTRDKIVTDNKSSEKLTWVFVSNSKINEKDRQKKKKIRRLSTFDHKNIYSSRLLHKCSVIKSMCTVFNIQNIITVNYNT